MEEIPNKHYLSTIEAASYLGVSKERCSYFIQIKSRVKWLNG
jgi:ribosome modulation factor